MWQLKYYIFFFLFLQQHAISIARTVAVPQVAVSQNAVAQIEVHVGQHSLGQVDDSQEREQDHPRILYQCGDCDELFKSLVLWQQHRKEGVCHQEVLASKPTSESHNEPQTFSAESPAAPLNPDESSRSQSESSINPEPMDETLNPTEKHSAQPSSPQSSEAPAAETDATTSTFDDSSPRRRGLNKKPKPEPVLLCVDCGSCFGLVSELVAHRKTQHGFGEALHHCSMCGESFLNTTLFLYHRKQHRQKGEETVKVFPKVCTQNSTRGAHSSSSTVSSTFNQPELYFCTHCGQSFGDGGGLTYHRKEKHGLSEPLHSCSHCGESFMNTTQYLYHRRLHCFTPTTQETDEAVDKTTTANRDNTVQTGKRLLSSSGDSGFPLPKRGRPFFRILSANALEGKRKSFLNKTTLQFVEGFDITAYFSVWSGNVNSDTKDELEGSSSADSNNMNHPPPAKLLHDWARTPLPHVCPYCGQTFTRRVFLRTHVYSHTGEKLFTCKVPVRNLIKVSFPEFEG